MLKLIGGELYQWDKCRKIAIDDPEGKITEIHYARDCDNSCIVVTVKTDESGAKYAEIPNILLQSYCPVFAYAVNVQSGESITIAASTFIVRQKGKPADYVYTETEVLCYKALAERITRLEETAGFPEGGAGSPSGGTGKDGVSPTIQITEITGGHKVTITDVNGAKNFDVMDGVNGQNGVSPTIQITEITGGHRITITDVNGANFFDVMDGQDGKDGAGSTSGGSGTGTGADGQDGKDGVSPTIQITEITGGHRITITDVNGVKYFDVMDGQNGASGQDGQDGVNGQDGVSPTIQITEITGGHKVTITDVNGTKQFDVMDGADGQDGQNGQDGANGKSAFEYAQEGGYTGTEEEFKSKLAAEANGLDPNLKLLVLGDSLFGNGGGKSFIKRLKCQSQNYAVSGASLAEIQEKKRVDGTYNTIIDQFTRFKNGDAPLFFNDTDKEWQEQPSSFWTRNFEYPDIILVDGGGNDYLSSSALGDVTKSPNIYPYVYADSPNYAKDTIVGALHILLRDIAMEYPKAQRFFLIMHRVYQCENTSDTRRLWTVRDTPGIRVPYTRTVDGKEVTTWEVLVNSAGTRLISNKNVAKISPVYVREFTNNNGNNDEYVDYNVGTIEYDRTNLFKNGAITNEEADVDETKIEGRYTYDKLRETIIKVCNMYGFKIIDIYNDSPLNVVPPTQNYNGTDYAVANTELLDWAGIHPTKLGYQIGYEPYVKAALRLGTKK